MTILKKYTLAVTGLILLAAGAVTLVALQSQVRALRAEALLRGRTIARNLASGSAEALLVGDPVTMISLAVDTQRDNQGVIYATVVGTDGKIRAHQDASLIGKNFVLENSRALTEAGEGILEAATKDGWVWDVSAEVRAKGSAKSQGAVHIGVSRAAVESALKASRNRLLAASMLLLVAGAGLSVLMVRVLVRPIRSLSAAAGRIGAGDLEVRVEVESQDELGQLSHTFNSMASNLKAAEKVKLEKERIQSELNVARSIQAGLLPEHPPKFSNVDVAFVCSPAKELGGDFFDWFSLENGTKLGLVIADVSGKGVPAALHMANLRNLMRFIVRTTTPPAEVLKQVNALAWPDLKGESFVTVMYAVYDLKSREIRYASAGHEPALKLSSSGEVEECRGKGMPVGVAEPEDFDFVIKEQSVTLAQGEAFVLFTDGVTEAMNAKEEQFGRDRMVEVVKRSRGPSEGVVKAVVEAVKTHAAGHEQSDDLTLLLLRTV